jgi:hypothetical protein
MTAAKPLPRVVVLSGGAAAVVALAVTLVAGSTTCGQDVSLCAETRDKNGVYLGTLNALDGPGPFEVSFASREDRSDVSFAAGSNGRYCIVWARETALPLATVGGGGPTALDDWRPLHGRPPPQGCQESDATIPWNRAKDLRSSWEYRLLLLLPVVALLLLGAGLAAKRSSGAAAVSATGAVLGVTALATCVILWSV